MSINLDITMKGIQNFIQKYKLIDAMYNDVPHVNVANDVAKSVFSSKKALCDAMNLR